MKKSFRKAFLRVGLPVIAAWLLMNAFIPRDPFSQSLVEIENLTRRAGKIRRHALSRAELAQSMPPLHVTLSCNQYQPEVQYFSPDNWIVRLVPKTKRAFVNPRSWTYRLVFLDLRTMQFPVIEIRSPGPTHMNPLFAKPDL
jgi:hypothetical protein